MTKTSPEQMNLFDPAAAPNRYQAQTSATKLRGQYYTPPALARLMLQALHPRRGDRILDPSCGDGRFLCAAVEVLAELELDVDHRAAADYWRERLVGFDIDEHAVRAARAGLRQAFLTAFGVDFAEERFHVYRADPLDAPSLAELPAPGPLREDERLLVIGNPPYVEAKRLDRAVKTRLKARYPDAVAGAPDLYLYFLHVCLGWLRADDRLAFVLPNRVLVTVNARQLRRRLLDDGLLAGLWFATRAQLFPGAAVYPVILFARGRQEAAGVEIRHLERAEEEITLSEPVTVPPDLYRHTEITALFPPPADPRLRGLLERLLQQRDRARVGGVLDIRWCVSFHRTGLREHFVTPAAPGSAFEQKFLGGGAFTGNGEVARYRLSWAGWWIDYDEERLRREGNGVPELTLFTQPKIVICQNSRTLRAAFDAENFVLKDTFLCGLPRDPAHPLCRHPRALVGLLCSEAVHFFFSHLFHGGHINGGYLHFLQSYLADIPLGEWTEELAETTATLVRERETAGPAEARSLETRIDACTARAFALSDAESAALHFWCAQDDNWQARDRIRPPT